MNKPHPSIIMMIIFLLGVAPATAPIRGVEDVERIYNDHIAACKRTYEASLTEAANERVSELRSLEDRALKNQDMDSAASLHEKIKAVEAPPDELQSIPSIERAKAMNALQQRLDDNLWHWGNDDYVRFEANGNVANASWSDRGLVTHWKVIDARTVLLTIVKGRQHDVYAILTFSTKADSFSGWDFEGRQLSQNYMSQGK